MSNCLNRHNTSLIRGKITRKMGRMLLMEPCYECFLGWVNELMLVLAKGKNMIISPMVSWIEISKEYKINLGLNMNYEQFCECEVDWK